MKEQFAKDGATAQVVVIINQMVIRWLNNHIRQVDKVLGAFLKDKIKPVYPG